MLIFNLQVRRIARKKRDRRPLCLHIERGISGIPCGELKIQVLHPVESEAGLC